MSTCTGFTKRALLAPALAFTVLGAAGRAGAALAPYMTLVNSRNPISYLMMDETSGTTAADSSPATGGNGTHPGTYAASGITYAQSSASANLKTAVSASGAVTPLTVAGATAFDGIGTGDFSVELWFNTPNITTREDLFTFKGGSSDFGIHLGSANTDRLSLYHNAFITTPTTLITANTWHQVVATRAGGTDTLYLDGASIGTGADAASVNTSGSPIEIGANTGNSVLFTGSLDEFAFYPSALSAAQVQADYVAGAPEPAGLGLVAVAALGLLARRRRPA